MENMIRGDARSAIKQFMQHYIDEEDQEIYFFDEELLARFLVSLTVFLKTKYGVTFADESYNPDDYYFKILDYYIAKQVTDDFQIEECISLIIQYLDMSGVQNDSYDSLAFYPSPLEKEIFGFIKPVIEDDQVIPFLQEFLIYKKDGSNADRKEILTALLNWSNTEAKEFSKFNEISYEESRILIENFFSYTMPYNVTGVKQDKKKRDKTLTSSELSILMNFLNKEFTYFTNVLDISAPFENPGTFVAGTDTIYGGEEVVFAAVSDRYVIFFCLSWATWTES